MITLTSGELRVIKILKPTTAKFFEDIKEGDLIEVFHKLEGTTGGSNGLYASRFLIKNHTQDTRIYKSGNNLVTRLDNFELGVFL